MKRLLIILFFLPLIGLGKITVTELTSVQKKQNLFVLGLRQHYGFILIHSKDLRTIKNSYPIGTELSFNWHKIDQESWNLCNWVFLSCCS